MAAGLVDILHPLYQPEPVLLASDLQWQKTQPMGSGGEADLGDQEIQTISKRLVCTLHCPFHFHAVPER
jgi:hypothetical protein